MGTNSSVSISMSSCRCCAASHSQALAAMGGKDRLAVVPPLNTDAQNLQGVNSRELPEATSATASYDTRAFLVLLVAAPIENPQRQSLFLFSFRRSTAFILILAVYFYSD